jgi:hypothetical protein
MNTSIHLTLSADSLAELEELEYRFKEALFGAFGEDFHQLSRGFNSFAMQPWRELREDHYDWLLCREGDQLWAFDPEDEDNDEVVGAELTILLWTGNGRAMIGRADWSHTIRQSGLPLPAFDTSTTYQTIRGEISNYALASLARLLQARYPLGNGTRQGPGKARWKRHFAGKEALCR